MKIQITLRSLLVLSMPALACAEDDETNTPVLRSAEYSVDMHAPTASDPIVATLAPGKPFLFNGRYHIASGAGVEPDMTRFAPANVGNIPRVYSGQTVKVVRNGQQARVRLIGVEEDDSITFVPQAASPFAPSFAKIPWSAWGTHATDVRDCAEAIEAEKQDCAEAAQGDFTACSAAAASELGNCASGQECDVESSLGVATPLQFECLLPAGSSVAIMGQSVNFTPGGFSGGCDCEFWGTVTYQPGDFECQEIWQDTLTACEPACDDDDEEDVWDLEGPIIVM